MNYPYISIIVPVYKVEKYIRNCVESIICQKGDWELILVDDGSPDGCPAICDEYAEKDERVQVIHKENGGVSTARNAGLDVARGEWIWFVDGDDYIVNNVINEIFQKISILSNTDYIQMGMNYLYDDKNIVVGEIKSVDNISKNRFFNLYISYYNHNILFKRDIIEKNHIRFTEGLKVAEDQEFQLKYMMLCDSPIQIPICAYVYRQRNGSVTHNNDTYARVINDTFKVLKNLNTFICENNISVESWAQNRITRMIKNILYAASQIKNPNKGEIKNKINKLAKLYKSIGIKSFDDKKIKIARNNITLYFLLNKYYLRIKGFKTNISIYI